MVAFEQVYHIVTRCGERFLEYLIEEHNLGWKNSAKY
jgi:hypothetical protein